MFADDTKVSRKICNEIMVLFYSRIWTVWWNGQRSVIWISTLRSVRLCESSTLSDWVWSMNVAEERDLGIFVTDDLKPSVQCAKAQWLKWGGSAPGSHLSPLQKYEPTWLNL